MNFTIPAAQYLPIAVSSGTDFQDIKPKNPFSVKNLTIRGRGGYRRIKCTDVPFIVCDKIGAVQVVQRKIGMRKDQVLCVEFGKQVFCLVSYAAFAIVIFNLQLQHHLQQRLAIKTVDKNGSRGNDHLHEEDGKKQFSVYFPFYPR